ncbi:MarR family winged helix-turn-helix transcriptional regulator [Fodinicola acaciae]|uniref:MarR family winged helix-turn-helix transcriptional regulator n=1 Tax=Fodinicola acaciae TaxID=2681555 RepID=UPI0013D4551F|nr:MarR family transcriptional regulator [Fodinicola acaciae]
MTAAPDFADDIVSAWGRELPQVESRPLELTKRIGRLAGLVDAATHGVLERLGLTKAEYEVLARLRAAGAPYEGKPNELTRSLSMSSGGTTNVLHRLVDAGLVARKADEGDRRSTWVYLTPKGIEAAEEVVLATNEAQSALLGRLPEATARALADLLRDALRDLEAPAPAYRR